MRNAYLLIRSSEGNGRSNGADSQEGTYRPVGIGRGVSCFISATSFAEVDSVGAITCNECQIRRIKAGNDYFQSRD